MIMQAQKRKRLQLLTWPALPLVIIGGLFKPVIGFLMFICMVGAIGLSFNRGRNWCDWMCPRGAFYDLFFTRISPNQKIPRFFRNKFTRMFMLGVIFTAIGVQFYLGWGNINAMGMAMVRILTVTTLAGIVLALFIHPRTWCQICPMGTIASWIGKGRKPVQVGTACTNCGLCARVCPMQLEPHAYREKGEMDHGDCLKCSTCIASCPRQALSFTSNNGATKHQDSCAA